ncbi:unnamed protein product, partial [Tetraodon nigroviridis]
FWVAAEDAVLSAIISDSSSSSGHFSLSPAYALYAAGRFALQPQPKPGSRVEGQWPRVTRIAGKMVAMMREVLQARERRIPRKWRRAEICSFFFCVSASQGQRSGAGALAFWMANSSELLNFLKRDRDLSPLTRQSQRDLAHLVHGAYSCLLQALQHELRIHLPTFLVDPERHGSLPDGMEKVLNTLMNAMSLLRRCRANPALTIQLFSQLFHFTSAWLFNQLMNPQAGAPGLRSHYWGAALRGRLAAVEAWAERQGLELAAECHLGRIIQATVLLTMDKYSVRDAKDIQHSCFRLNSLQLRALLIGYLRADDEPRIPPELTEAVVAAAEASADELIRSEGRRVQLEESLDLGLPFLLPDAGFSCDTMRGIPPGFLEFLEPVCQKGLCHLTIQTNSEGIWTVHFTGSASAPSTGVGRDHLGIYVKSIVEGGPAARVRPLNLNTGSSETTTNLLMTLPPERQVDSRGSAAERRWKKPGRTQPRQTVTREYVTLPALKSQEKNEPKSSQEHQASTLLKLQISSKKSSLVSSDESLEPPRSTSGGEGSAPTKHVSFQDPPAQPRPCLKTRGDPEQGTDVWRRRREAQAKPEKPKELGEVELLEQEVQRLWVKEERTTEENDRLRRLSLEWQFQKRLQEIQKKGDDDGEEEEDEDLDALLMMQQLERQTQASGTPRYSPVSRKMY